MKFLHIADQEWSSLKQALEAGNNQPGAFLVCGPSEQLAQDAQSVVERASQLNASLTYFHCCSGDFHVPSYVPFVRGRIESEPVDAAHLLVMRFNLGLSPAQHMATETVSKLEQAAYRAKTPGRAVIVECLMPLTPNDLGFVELLLQSELARHSSVVVFAHEQSGDPTYTQWVQEQSAAAADLLAMLYLCGGRVRTSEWFRLVEYTQLADDCWTDLVATRQFGSETLICYASREVAEAADEIFRRMDQAQKGELARKVLRTLAFTSGYPLLEIAAETGDLHHMLLNYSSHLLDTALLEPEGLAKYYSRLQSIAQTTGHYALTDVARMSYFLSLLYIDKSHAVQIYDTLQGALPDTIDKKTENLFWNFLGQNLALLNQPTAWQYATHCFKLSYLSLDRAENVSPEERRLSIATNANGEALLAYKQKQGKKAHWLVECALNELSDLSATLYYQAHIRTNLGDVLLKTIGNVDDAIAQYEQAMGLMTRASRNLTRQVGPRKVRMFRHRSALKLGYALIRAKRVDEAILVLKNLLAYLSQPSIKDGAMGAMALLKTREALASAYLERGDQRRAVACYWSILRNSDWLEPAMLSEAAEKIRCYRPDIDESRRRRINRVISLREAHLADVKKAQQLLTCASLGQFGAVTRTDQPVFEKGIERAFT